MPYIALIHDRVMLFPRVIAVYVNCHVVCKWNSNLHLPYPIPVPIDSLLK